MADSRWVVNASPLILLGKIGQIGLLSALAGRIAVPQAVAEEIGAGPLVRRLRETGLYASDDLIQRLLREVGE